MGESGYFGGAPTPPISKLGLIERGSTLIHLSGSFHFTHDINLTFGRSGSRGTDPPAGTAARAKAAKAGVGRAGAVFWPQTFQLDGTFFADGRKGAGVMGAMCFSFFFEGTAVFLEGGLPSEGEWVVFEGWKWTIYLSRAFLSTHMHFNASWMINTTSRRGWFQQGPEGTVWAISVICRVPDAHRLLFF